MRIALVRPWHHSHLRQPALALGYLSACLRRAGHRVRVIDGLLEETAPRALAARCADAELVGVSCLSDYFEEVVKLCRHLRRPGRRIVLGGPHPTFLPGPSLALTGADYAVLGEGEATLVELARRIEDGSAPADLPGVATRGRPAPERGPLLPDLDALPFPDWSDCLPARFPPAPHGGVARRYPIAPVVTTRGCPHDCSFCASPALWRRTVRFRSPEAVVDEIAHAKERYGVREIHFEDDNLTLRRRHVEAIAEGLLRRRLGLAWATPNGIRVDSVDRELLRLMKRSGCYSVAFGIESADPEVRARANKRTSLDAIERAIGLAADEGLLTQGFFVFGLPGETRESIDRTIRFAERSRLDKAQFLLLDVLPGSRLWEEHRADAAPPGSYQSFHDPSWCPPGLDRQELRRAPRRAFARFFSSPRRVLRLARMVRPAQLRYVVRRMRDFRLLPRER